ncbi:alpha-(1,3)-fucosyltransferase C-like [Haliotis rubra]|uniref:alpha-(1,3)-fucosyltransferase C-like n=1 Tax=Haliotis rubra TaxID=36100 RepID=UPI001EE521D5|nr:alpha-(1,3)-fucosyltransferase C-like [Haliotis rubra]
MSSHIQRALQKNDQDTKIFQIQASPRKFKYCLYLLIAAVVCGTVTVCYNESSFMSPGMWTKWTVYYPITNYNKTINRDVSVAKTHLQKMVFKSNSTFPHFYKPVSFHSSDKYRQKRSYSVDFTHGYRPVTSTKSKLILFHNPPRWFTAFQKFCPQGLQKCPQKHCECSFDTKRVDKADAVIFDGVELHLTPPLKQTNQVWIMFGLECPYYYNNQLSRSEHWRHMFNWTMTYRLDSDVILPYNVLFQLQQPPKVNFSQIALNKTKSVLWFVSNCNTQSKRQQYVKELRKHISVDIYGRCGPLKCSGPKCDFLYNQYRFYLSFENSFCVDYATEKLFKVYAHNIVPVVRGGADYNSLVPNGTYINAADFSSPKELATYLKYLETNVTAYAEILENKSKYTHSHTGTTYESAFCDICVKLHNLDKYQQYYFDSVRWLREDTCHYPK